MHVVLVLVGYAALLFTAVAAVLYLMQERELKRKKPRSFYHRLPPLGTLDDLITSFMGLGFVLITLAVIAGSTWAFVELGTRWIADPKIAHFAFHLGHLPGDGLSARLGGLARPQSRGHGDRGAGLLGAHLGGACAVAERSGPMKLLVTGVSHNTAPVEVRERLAFAEAALPAALENLVSSRRHRRSHDSLDLQSRGDCRDAPTMQSIR